MAEQLICNQQVNGSSPFIGYFGWIPEWPKGADCKSVSCAFEGSNPSPPIISLQKEFFYCKYRGVEQLAARRAHNPEVAGSSPVPATLNLIIFYAQIAQLVEQRTENPRVTGSIPVLGTRKQQTLFAVFLLVNL